MLPVTRKIARLRGEIASIDRRLKNVIPELQNIERLAELQKNNTEAVVDRMKGSPPKRKRKQI